MNNYRNNRKNRFKPSSDRNYRKRPINGIKNQSDFNTNSDFRHRSPGRNNQNAAKLVEKYSNLAREALSSGDKILSENYLQHADHFTRILNERESYKRERLSDSNDSLVDETTENSEDVSKGDSLKSLKDGSEIKKITKSQADIN